MDLEQEIKKLEKEYADLRKIFDDTVGKLVSEKIAREITYATEIEQLTERNKKLEAALQLYAGLGRDGIKWEPLNDNGGVARVALGEK